MSGFRQSLSGMNRTAVQTAILRRDETYGKQLASQFERYSLVLRAYFGGTPKWAVHQDLHLRRKGASSDEV